jgi:hypothetical protein
MPGGTVTSQTARTVAIGRPAPHQAARQQAARVLAVLLAVFWGFFFYGLIDLLAFGQGPDFHASLVLSTGWGLLFLVLVAGPLGTVAVRPGTRTAALGQVAVAAVAVGVAAALSGSPRHLLVAGGLLATAIVLVAVRPPTRASAQAARTPWAPGLLVVLAAGPACAYAWAAARTTGSGTLTDDTWGLDHWPVQAAFPLAVLGVAALAAARPAGWWLPTWTVVISAAWFGVVCWLEPDLVGWPGRGWATVVLAWTIGFVLAQLQPSRPAEGHMLIM